MSSTTKTEKYEFLDGLRAVAMLIVLFFHTLTILPATTVPNAALNTIRRYSLHGQVGVVMFIVLSGYCLMLPVARSADGKLRGGRRGFIHRRALRILPAYYAILVASILLAFSMTYLQRYVHFRAGDFAQGLTARNILTHTLLIHNVWFNTNYTLNAGMWSVATEWDIYFVFALLLLPMWRRFGIVLTTLAGFGLGILPLFALPETQNFSWARPWYIGLFCIGMFAATAEFRPQSRDLAFCGKRLKFLTVPSAAALFGLLVLIVHVVRNLSPWWTVDTLVGTATALLIAACMQTRRAPEGSACAPIVAIRNVLEHPWLVALAGFSYTAYLIQFLILKGTMAFSSVLHLSSPGAALVNLLLGVPVLLLLSSWLANYIEKPFVSRHAMTIPLLAVVQERRTRVP